ncbi:MAG: hypothetical protein JRF57_13595 [Deltaproteobacteria bacterium]|nr:hypothetical protein [Deltaproteobacteria bacterium]
MKKFLAFFLAAAMVLGAGTALAANTVELSTATSGVSTVYWGPVFSRHSSGLSAYVVTGAIFNAASKLDAGTTLYAISNTLTNTDGTELRVQALKFVSGATPIGPPQLISGTTTTVVLYVLAPGDERVGSSATDSGNTLYIIDGGTGTLYHELGIPGNGLGYAAFPASSGAYDLANAGSSPYCLAPVTIDNENTSYSGATIFGITSAGVTNSVGDSGISIWAVSAQTGTYTTNSSGNSNVTGFPSASGVSVIHTAPVISGDSLFVIGYSSTGSGNTIFQFAKNNIYNGIVTSATVGLNADLSNQWIPTPCVSGGSIFVVDNEGGVSSFRTDNLSLNYGVRYTGSRITTGVTAAPVTDGTYIVVCSTSAVTCFKLDNLSQAATSSAAQWAYDFGANKSIWATPAISGGYVWVTVNDTLRNTSTTYRFELASTASNGGIAQINTYGDLTYGDPILVDSAVWTVSYDPVVRKIADSHGDAKDYWPQLKFDKAKTGNNTDTDDVEPTTDDGGCFISTIIN